MTSGERFYTWARNNTSCGGENTEKAEVKALLLLMDTDKNGKISKQEWMKFMEAEFDRLDNDKSGELGPKELLQLRITADMSSPVNAP